MFEPKMNKMVVVKAGNCDCDGHKPGVVGFVKIVEHPDAFVVQKKDSEEMFWHCRNCVTDLK